MKTQEIIFAGFGGQGILSMGKFLAYAGMEAKLNVTWLPSYGAEMRGGTANCSVILSSDSIGSPVITKADTVVAMNSPSLDKFESFLKPGGVLIIDSNFINRNLGRQDIEVIAIPAQTLAEEIGNKKIANMILLGALVKKTEIVSMELLLEALRIHGKEGFYEINKRALEKGAKVI